MLSESVISFWVHRQTPFSLWLMKIKILPNRLSKWVMDLLLSLQLTWILFFYSVLSIMLPYLNLIPLLSDISF